VRWNPAERPFARIAAGGHRPAVHGGGGELGMGLGLPALLTGRRSEPPDQGLTQWPASRGPRRECDGCPPPRRGGPRRPMTARHRAEEQEREIDRGT